MIYICQAPGTLCKTGCKALTGVCSCAQGACDCIQKECGENVATLCKLVGDSCGQVFANCGNGCSGVVKAVCTLLEALFHLITALLAGLCSLVCSFIRVDQPLGPFILLSVIVNVPAAYNGLCSMTQRDVMDCSQAPLAKFVKIDVAIAIVHVLFAMYMKHQVIYGHREQPAVDAFNDSQAVVTAAAAQQVEMPMPTSVEVGMRLRSIALYDFGFCIYFFVFFGSFGYQFYGFSYGHVCDLALWSTWNMTALEMFYPFLAIGYALLFLCFTGIKAGGEKLQGNLRRPFAPHAQHQQAGASGAPYVALPNAPVVQQP